MAFIPLSKFNAISYSNMLRYFLKHLTVSYLNLNYFHNFKYAFLLQTYTVYNYIPELT